MSNETYRASSTNVAFPRPCEYDRSVMPILVRNVRLALDEPESHLVIATAKRLKVPASAIRTYSPIRRSLDARRHDDVHFVYHVEVAWRWL